MPTIRNSIRINAPVEKVFAYVTQPTNSLEWMVSLTEVRNVTGSGVGQRWGWEYTMVGIPFQGESTVTQSVPNKLHVFTSKGGITSKFTWSFAPEQGGTRLDMDVEYSIPGKVLGRLAERLVLRRNEREAALNIHNIKEHVEGVAKVEVPRSVTPPL